MTPRVLVIDNYDSFTFNLVQYLGELGAIVDVFKNDGIDVAGIRARAPDGILVSPGPCTPNEAGVSLDVLRLLGREFPIFGVCLGHQAIGQAFGGRVVRADRLMHGKTSPILHDGRGLFEGLPSPFEATRYHSLIVERASLPACLEVSAWTAEGEIMGLRHRELAVEGVQFHPESVLTLEGKPLVANWVRASARARRRAVMTAGAEFPGLLARLLGQAEVDAADVRAAFDAILAGAWTPVQVGAFAVALRMRGESAEAIVSAAEAMRAAMTAVEHAHAVVVDTCGTGGDGAHTLNLSSAAAVVVAACGVVVAKHGNRSVSSRCGSADVVEALGIPVDVAARRGSTRSCARRGSPSSSRRRTTRRCVTRRRRGASSGRGRSSTRSARWRTLRARRHQLIGVYEDRLRPVAARALGRLGGRRAWVVRGEDGLDEVSPCAPTRVSELARGRRGARARRVAGGLRHRARRPRRPSRAAMRRRTRARSWPSCEGERHPAREAVVLNAAAALVVATGEDPRGAAARARARDRQRRGARRRSRRGGAPCGAYAGA